MRIEKSFVLGTMVCLALFAAALVPCQARGQEFALETAVPGMVGTWVPRAVDGGDFASIDVKWADEAKTELVITITQTKPDPVPAIVGDKPWGFTKKTCNATVTAYGPLVFDPKNPEYSKCKGRIVDQHGYSEDVTFYHRTKLGINCGVFAPVEQRYVVKFGPLQGGDAEILFLRHTFVEKTVDGQLLRDRLDDVLIRCGLEKKTK